MLGDENINANRARAMQTVRIVKAQERRKEVQDAFDTAKKDWRKRPENKSKLARWRDKNRSKYADDPAGYSEAEEKFIKNDGAFKVIFREELDE